MKKIIVLIFTFILIISACSKQESKQEIRIYSLSGPTSMAIAKLLNDNDQLYQKNIVSDASVISNAIAKNEADIAILPANLAYSLYNKTNDFKVVAITTLNVLYIVSSDKTVTDFTSLRGKTVFLTGQGTTPDLVMNNLLDYYGLKSEVNLSFKGSANEVALAISSNLCDTALLPQPFVTVALSKNPNLSIVMDLSSQWQSVYNNSQLVTAVAIVKNDFIANYPQQFKQFLSDLQNSITWMNNNNDAAGQLVVDLGILDNQQIAKKALPQCSLTYIDNKEMKQLVTDYLNILYGATVDENFFYIEN